jgi:hypothetical protein
MDFCNSAEALCFLELVFIILVEFRRQY